MIEQTLLEIGLKDKEIKVYLELLHLKEASASVLSYKTGLTTGNTRYICNQLVKMGLISTTQKNNTTVFLMETPRKLFFLLNEEKKKISEKEENVNRIIRDLEGIANPDTKLPKVRFYEGYKGLKESYFRIINECKDFEVYSIFSVVEEIGVDLQQFFVNEYVPKRVRHNIFMKNICLDSPKGRAYKKRDSEELRETRFLSPDFFPTLNAEINIYGDFIHYMSFDETNAFAMIVRDEKLTEMLKSVFKLLWSTTSKN